MGMFTDVIIEDKGVLPKRLQCIQFEYQTKDCVVPEMETLTITRDNKLKYEWYEYESVPNENSYFKFSLRKTLRHIEILDFHGDMHICGVNHEIDKFVDLIARFTEGNLQWIKEDESISKKA